VFVDGIGAEFASEGSGGEMEIVGIDMARLFGHAVRLVVPWSERQSWEVYWACEERSAGEAWSLPTDADSDDATRVECENNCQWGCVPKARNQPSGTACIDGRIMYQPSHHKISPYPRTSPTNANVVPLLVSDAFVRLT